MTSVIFDAPLTRADLRGTGVWWMLFRTEAAECSRTRVVWSDFGRMPRAAHNDPSTGQAIGFQFIPFFNLYWTFFNPLRLCDRITLQYRLRGRSDEAPKGMVLASAVVSMIPYVNMISLLILWTISTCLLQHKINQLIALGPVEMQPQLEAA